MAGAAPGSGAMPAADARAAVAATMDSGTGQLPGQGLAPWRARLALRFALRAGRTVMVDQAHEGPLLVQRPFYPEADGTCHAYLLHPPGGIVGGDRLRIEAQVEPGAQVLLTTPAAGKFYRSAGTQAEQVHVLRVAEGGCLEWFPQETIVYRAAHAQQRTQVLLEAGARFIGWDLLCLGRPASGEVFSAGSFVSGLEIWRAGRRVLAERAAYAGGSAVLGAPWGLASFPVTALLVAASDDARLAGRVREALTAAAESGAAAELEAVEPGATPKPVSPREADRGGSGRFAVTHLDGLLVARYLGPQVEAARRVLMAVWRVARPALLGKAAAVPRIWYT